MRNEFYHAFLVGFNWWMVAGMTLFILAIVLGTKRPVLSDGKVKNRFRAELLSLYAAVAAILWGMLFVLESHRGILQFFDNIAARDDHPLYAMLAAGCAFIVVPGLFGLVLYATTRVSYFNKYGRLVDEVVKIKRHNKNRKIAMAKYLAEARVKTA